MLEQAIHWPAMVREGRQKANAVATRKNTEQMEIPAGYDFWLFKQAVLFLLWEGWKIQITEEAHDSEKKIIKITQKYPTVRQRPRASIPDVRLRVA